MWNGATHQTRVAALRHDRNAGGRAHAEGFTGLGRRPRPNQRERSPPEATRPVDLVRGEDAGIRNHGRLAERGAQGPPDVVVAHPLSVRRRPGQKVGAS